MCTHTCSSLEASSSRRKGLERMHRPEAASRPSTQRKPLRLTFPSRTNTWLQYNYAATNHPVTLTLHLSSAVERYRLISPNVLDTQVLTHLLTHVDGFTCIISACERLLRTPIPLGYNIAISRIVWIFVFALPSQLWGELGWWSIAVTMITAYALFALAEVGLEIENVS
jgi:predicted membrane chloride channel (bestrophin family)